MSLFKSTSQTRKFSFHHENMCHPICFLSFLGYQFTTYGWDVLTVTAQSPEDRADPMNMVFPKVTKCTFHKYGPSGTITQHDGLCILALNIINEKIYVFLWFWFDFVAIFSAMAILYRMVMLLVPGLRVNAIMARYLFFHYPHFGDNA